MEFEEKLNEALFEELDPVEFFRELLRPIETPDVKVDVHTGGPTDAVAEADISVKTPMGYEGVSHAWLWNNGLIVVDIEFFNLSNPESVEMILKHIRMRIEKYKRDGGFRI